MKISKEFVITFLVCFLLVILGNIVALTMNFYKGWMLYLAVFMFAVLFFLIFRKHKAGFIRVSAYVLPVILILVVLYFNFLPFGFHKEYTITIGADGSVLSSSSQIFLQDMKGKVITNLIDVYSYGQINVIVKPKAVLRNATVNISIINSNSSNVYLAKTNFNISTNKWDYFWDFTKGIPSPLNGTAKYNKNLGCVYFNGSLNQTLSYPNSSNMFENDSFVVYAKWKPSDMNGTAQQIIGHFNWELWQNNNSVRFMVGRLDNKNGSMPSISYPVNASFFNQPHSAFAIYSADKNNSSGYIELYMDNQFAGRKTISNQTIWADYGERNLTSGWSSHNYGNNSYYTGCVYQTGFDYTNIKYLSTDSFTSESKTIPISILGNGKPREIKLAINARGFN